jgi:hypothetical protein
MSTDSNGDFELLADPGVFHVAARPESSTGFAWSVLLGVDLAEMSDVGSVRLPLPLVMTGILTSQDTGGLVPNALMRIYALLKEGKPVSSIEDADQVVAVGETRANDEGRFRLLIPSTLQVAE